MNNKFINLFLLNCLMLFIFSKPSLIDLPDVEASSKLTKEEKLKLNNQLIEAAKKGDLNAVQNLVNSGANVNYKNRSREMPLLCAIWHTSIVKYLLENGANRYIKNAEARSCLDLIVFNNNIDSLRLILKKFNSKKYRKLLKNALFWALHACKFCPDTSIIELLIESGAKVNHQMEWRAGHKSILDIFLESFKDIMYYSTFNDQRESVFNVFFTRLRAVLDHSKNNINETKFIEKINTLLKENETNENEKNILKQILQVYNYWKSKNKFRIGLLSRLIRDSINAMPSEISTLISQYAI